MKVFIYRKSRDDGRSKEQVRVFTTREAAQRALAKDVMDEFAVDVSAPDTDSIFDDTVTEDYVALDTCEGFAVYQIDERNVEVSSEPSEMPDQEAREKIFREVQHAYFVEDAVNHVAEYLSENEPTQDGDTTFDYDFLAELFESRHDCNVADNDQWREIIAEYVRANAGRD